MLCHVPTVGSYTASRPRIDLARHRLVDLLWDESPSVKSAEVGLCSGKLVVRRPTLFAIDTPTHELREAGRSAHAQGQRLRRSTRTIKNLQSNGSSLNTPSGVLSNVAW